MLEITGPVTVEGNLTAAQPSESGGVGRSPKGGHIPKSPTWRAGVQIGQPAPNGPEKGPNKTISVIY